MNQAGSGPSHQTRRSDGPASGFASFQDTIVECDNHRENRALYVRVAVGERFVERDFRVIAFDEEARRYGLRRRGSAKAKTFGLVTFELPYADVPYGVVYHIGVELRKP